MIFLGLALLAIGVGDLVSGGLGGEIGSPRAVVEATVSAVATATSLTSWVLALAPVLLLR